MLIWCYLMCTYILSPSWRLVWSHRLVCLFPIWLYQSKHTRTKHTYVFWQISHTKIFHRSRQTTSRDEGHWWLVCRHCAIYSKSICSFVDEIFRIWINIAILAKILIIWIFIIRFYWNIFLCLYTSFKLLIWNELVFFLPTKDV